MEIVGVEVLIAADVESSAADDRVSEVGVGRLLPHLELAGDVESVVSDIGQIYRTFVVESVDSPVGIGGADLV